MSVNNRASSTAGLVIGAVLSMIISGALVIATAKAGISPGVSPLVVLIGWVVFGSLMKDRLKPFLAVLQVTGSGGAAVSAGLIFTAPILQITADLMGQPIPGVDIATTMLACVAGSLMGWGFVGLAAKRFLTDPRLPAPEAVACDQLIQTAVANPDDRPPVSLSLLPALLSGFLAQALMHLKWMQGTAFVGKISLPGFAADNPLKLPVPVSPLFLGIGALLTFPTAVLVFVGGVVNAATKVVSVENGLPTETYRWVGGAAMVVAVVYSLINYMIEGLKASAANAEGGQDVGNVGAEFGVDAASDDLLSLTPTMRTGLMGAIAIGGVLMFVILHRQGLPPLQVLGLGVVSLVLISLLSGLGGLLSLQVGASASPVSGTVFMAMLVLSLASIALGQSGYVAVVALQPVLVATCVAIAAANDSSQDYKTMQLNGFNVSSAYTGQLIGCVVGAITVPISLWVAHEAFTLGSEALPCPQASFFGTVLSSLFDPNKGIPWTPVCVGLGLGCVAVAVEVVGRIGGLILSSLAFAVGIYLPAEMGIGILLGNLARVIATGSLTRSSHRGILAAAGFIAGDSMLSLLAGVFIVCQVDLSSFEAAKSQGWPMFVGAVVVFAMLAFQAFAYLDSRKTDSKS